MKTTLFLLLLFLTFPANAVVNAGGDQNSPPADDPGFNNVGTTVPPQVRCGGSGLGGVYMGNGWVLTAGHVGANDMCFNGNRYSWDQNTPTVQFSYQGVTQDLILFRLVPPWPDQDPTIHPLPIISQTPTQGTQATLIGNGDGRGDPSTEIMVSCPFGPGGQCPAWPWVGETSKTWGHATVTGPIFGAQFETFFDLPPADTSNGAIGDSGGGVFIKVNGVWMLAGIMDQITGYCDVQNTSVQGCQGTAQFDLSLFRSQIVLYTVGPVACGAGPELALVVPLLMWLRSRRRGVAR